MYLAKELSRQTEELFCPFYSNQRGKVSRIFDSFLLDGISSEICLFFRIGKQILRILEAPSQMIP